MNIYVWQYLQQLFFWSPKEWIKTNWNCGETLRKCLCERMNSQHGLWTLFPFNCTIQLSFHTDILRYIFSNNWSFKNSLYSSWQSHLGNNYKEDHWPQIFDSECFPQKMSLEKQSAPSTNESKITFFKKIIFLWEKRLSLNKRGREGRKQTEQGVT